MVLIPLVIGYTPPLVSGLAVLGLIVGVILLRSPVLGAYGLVLSVPVQRLVGFDAGPIEITVTQVLFVVVLGIWWAWLAVREDRPVRLTPIGAALIFFYVAILTSLSVATSLPQALAELSRWLVAILAYIIIVNSVHTRRQMNGLIAVMLIATTSEAALGLVQAYTGVGPESFSVEGELTRAYGTIGAPNSFAGYLNMSLPLIFALSAYLWGRWAAKRSTAHFLDRAAFLSVRYLWKPVLMTLLALVIFWTLITTLSRGAWIGLAAGVFAMVLALGRRAVPVIALLFTLAFALVGLGLVGALPAPITERVGLLLSQIAIFDPRGVVPNPENYALIERMVHWHAAGNMFLSNPLLGVGIGNYNTLFAEFGVQGWPRSAGHAHNYYLHTLGETGLVGLAFYLVMLLTALATGISALRRSRAAGDNYGEAVVIGALGILVTFMAHNFFEDLHVLNMGIHWGAALALFTLVRMREEG